MEAPDGVVGEEENFAAAGRQEFTEAMDGAALDEDRVILMDRPDGE
jgi:hypothetical protein